MRTGICKLCYEYALLQNSHALPDSIFKYITRKSDGKIISIVDDDSTPIRYSSDTWGAELLCTNCEASLNQKYDAYGISVFRGHGPKTHKDSSGVSFLKIDQHRLRMFFLAVLWRMSISDHLNYSRVDLPMQWENELRLALVGNRSLVKSKYIVTLYKLRDSTPENGFSNEILRNFVTSPFPRIQEQSISICFPFMGFFVEIFLPKLPSNLSSKNIIRQAVLSGSNAVFKARYIEVLEIPEIMQTMVNGLGKHLSGKSNVT
jgi:hypothetical protein